MSAKSDFQPLLSTLPGLGPIVSRELDWRTGHQIHTEILTSRNNELVIPRALNPKLLLQLATVEDVFWLLGRIDLTGERTDLKRLSLAPKVLTSALHERWELLGEHPRPVRSFRVVVQAPDAKWRTYRRLDLQTAATQYILRSGVGLTFKPEAADIELWLHQLDHKLLISLRLTDSSKRHRAYQIEHRPGAIRPVVAAAMALVSKPQDSDVVLDPMCGSATILIERAQLARYAKLIGSDTNPGAITAATANFGRKHKPWQLHQWDALNLPLDAGSINTIITNPPWGRKIDASHPLPAFYQAFLKESERLLKSAGRLVVVVNNPKLVIEPLSKNSHLKLVEQISGLSVLGQKAAILVIEKERL